MPPQDLVGPILYSHGLTATGHAVAALMIAHDGAPPPVLSDGAGTRVAPVEVDALGGRRAWRYAFEVAPTAPHYVVDGRPYPIACDFAGDLRIGYVSCNGKERDDFERTPAERNAMWHRLLDRHRTAPLSLLLHGGDQIYADLALESHPALAAWAETPHAEADRPAATQDMEAAATAFFFDRWLASVADPGVAELLSQVPSIMMWDDHDIFDGWGSHKAPVQNGPVGQMLFRVARRFFRLFQAGGAGPNGAATLTSTHRYGDFAVLAPDLRSERKKTRVMGPDGWAHLEGAVADAPDGQRLFVLSSVPALGPRLSWIEAIHKIFPGAQKYEDDLRDQWQSQAHREEWRRLLRLFAERMERAAPVTFLSGEIHLATRGEMTLLDGRRLHQLTASGVAHPPPPQGFATALGWLALLGAAPLPDRPIKLQPLPGRRAIYTAERNTLTLSRTGGQWTAVWDLEHSGPTPPLDI